ncbi:pyridoxine 5'-phosphate synthase [Halobacteriovorax sp. XZX-3]|uniref:pyridoxine 5'-phosphate synthase n=1 Tax=unclassified Halobacteriovorax TaxID=2639665 RepID=UPI000CD0D7C6|nr:pyridoxine 5'-phosphate synthase [Halobacteriovorax sp. DA5]POB14284.1 pyridoxine 5'-phosphate synthase [Halobacteriovorax sp. DA5]
MTDKMIPRLGVNIDHVATLRQQRDEGYPSVANAAQDVLMAGADQITIHLREDRRHIQDTDLTSVMAVTKRFEKPLNLEIGCAKEIVEIAADFKPDWICLVPEKREEKTTEGGLDLSAANFDKVSQTMSYLREHSPKTKISLFVEASTDVMKKAIELKADAVEIHTGAYAIDFLKEGDLNPHLNNYVDCFKVLEGTGVAFHAGHGLTMESVRPLLEQGLFAEYNIGHWIVSQAVFSGISNVTRDMLNLFRNHPVK